MNPWTETLVAGLSLVGTVLVAWMTQRGISRRAKSDAAQSMIDQLQEERDAADKRRNEADARHRQEIAELRRDMSELRRRLEGVEDREMAYADYAAKLRDHIDQRLPPPPPEWPAALLRRRPDRPTDC